VAQDLKQWRDVMHKVTDTAAHLQFTEKMQVSERATGERRQVVVRQNAEREQNKCETGCDDGEC
jgi:hypothetical protein